MSRFVSVIIPTHNRFASLLAAVASVKRQTHGNVEVIVVNDGSSNPAYYSTRPVDVTWLDLPKPTTITCGRPCPGHARNAGLSLASGDLVAFLDDDDLWLPEKLSMQLGAMARTGHRMCCTDGLMGDGPMRPRGRYPVYLREYFGDFCVEFYERTGRQWTGRLPDVFTREFVRDHNFIITSSVVVERTLLDETGGFNCLPKGQEDVDLWLRCLDHVDCLHVHEPLIYYDGRLGLARRKRDAQPHRRIARRLRRLLA